ncbi:MAG: hypothetical protein ABEK02_05770 [Haloquadratum sp.]
MVVAPEEGGAARAQTTVDFAVGASLFLLVTAFVVAFIPTIFAPFASVDSPQTADRLATSLATDDLGDPGGPYVLNATCTDGFFAQLRGGPNAPTACRFDTTADTTTAVFTLEETTAVNVSVRTLDGGVADGGTWTAGPPLPETASVTAARRVVFVGGETYRLLVRTW